MRKFWLVYVDGTASTSFRHQTLDSAQREAENLVRKTRKGAVVLEAIEYCQIPSLPLEWTGINC